MIPEVTDVQFKIIKAACIALWEMFDDEFGYTSEKISQISNLKNTGDNWGYMVAMFDSQNRINLTITLQHIGNLLGTYAFP